MRTRGSHAVIGLDVGTTSTKAGLYLPDGRALALADRGYPLHTPRPGRVEQDPVRVVRAATDALAEVAQAARRDGTTVAGLCVSTAMHTLLGLDDDGRPCTPLWTYADTRARRQARALRREHPEVYRATGTPLHPMAPLAKLRWVAQEAPGLAAQVHRWVTIKELLLACLGGRTVIDRSSASTTGLCSLRTGTWDPDACALAGVDPDRLAPIVPTDHVIDGLTRDAARRSGLPPDTPVVVGATDGVLASLGVGALGDGAAALTIGTSGAVRVTVDRPVTDAAMRLFCYHLTPDHWVVGGAISNGGLWVRWLREQLFRDLDEDADVVALAGEVPPGSDGLLVLPYLVGERAPQWSAAPSGVVFGAGYGHGRGHLVRAGLEGSAHQLRLVLDAIDEQGLDVRRLRASGGFTRSDLWVQTVCDVLGVPVDVADVREAAAFGAAVLGMAALGAIDSIDAAADRVGVGATYEPEPATRARYDAAQRRYAELVDVLADPFDHLADARDDG